MRRAWDSNPQPLAGHLISSQAASQFAYPPETEIYPPGAPPATAVAERRAPPADCATPRTRRGLGPPTLRRDGAPRQKRQTRQGRQIRPLSTGEPEDKPDHDDRPSYPRARSPRRLAATVSFERVRPDATMVSTAARMRSISGPRAFAHSAVPSGPGLPPATASATSLRWAAAIPSIAR